MDYYNSQREEIDFQNFNLNEIGIQTINLTIEEWHILREYISYLKYQKTKLEAKLRAEAAEQSKDSLNNLLEIAEHILDGELPRLK